jgi:hypothetical protein
LETGDRAHGDLWSGRTWLNVNHPRKTLGRKWLSVDGHHAPSFAKYWRQVRPKSSLQPPVTTTSIIARKIIVFAMAQGAVKTKSKPVVQKT